MASAVDATCPAPGPSPTVAAESSTVDAASVVPGPSLPVAPEAVQKWLRKEDWEALTKAWQEAETQAIAWADGSASEEELNEELWQEANNVAAFSHTTSVSSLPPLSQGSFKQRRKRAKWDEAFSLLGSDSRKPPARRRYFDELPSESSLPKHKRGDGCLSDLGFSCPEHLKVRRSWAGSHHQTVSPDNPGLHPHLRTYFDRRGLESCYKQRPHIDQTCKKLRPRTPQRPSTRENILRLTQSEPSLGQASVSASEDEVIGTEGRHHGGMHWGARCLQFGQDIKAKSQKGEKIPWVKDHCVSVAYDNTGLNPTLRHYFDADGLESSFRNRGHHYGRPQRIPDCILRVGQGKSSKAPGVSAPRPTLVASGSGAVTSTQGTSGRMSSGSRSLHGGDYGQVGQFFDNHAAALSQEKL